MGFNLYPDWKGVNTVPLVKTGYLGFYGSYNTQTRTLAPRAAKADVMKTPVFKPIPTRQEQVVDIEADKPNVNEGGFEQSGQHFSHDVQSSDNISDGTKGCTGLHSDKMNVEIDSQQLIPDELLRSINLNYLHSEKVVQYDCRMNRGITDLSSNSLVNSEVELATEEKLRTPPNTQKVTNDEQRDEQLWPNSQNTISDEFLRNLNVYDKKSIMINPSANREVKTPRPKLRIKRPSKFKESPYTKKFDSVADTKIVKNFKDWISADLLKAIAKSGHYAAVLVEIEKIAKIISLCLQACNFYVKKGIDLQNHPRYKDKESSDMSDVLFEDDLPQQPCGSLDCGVFMVMYAKCLSYDHKVIATEFDPKALRTRYAALLWDYGIQK
ncbi:hypothetical protein FXO38_32920 [Capsicum annuum]|nr:hypothetical protein FXO38_32920 [Capsicum annuum]